MSTSCGGRYDSLHSSANCRDSAHVARAEPHLLQSLLPMGTGVSSCFPADAASLFRAQLFHWTGRGAWWRGIVLLRQRSTSPRYPEQCDPGRHGDVLVVPLGSPIRSLRPRNLARRSVSHLHARSMLLAVVLHHSDIWSRVPNRKELTIYRIDPVSRSPNAFSSRVRIPTGIGTGFPAVYSEFQSCIRECISLIRDRKFPVLRGLHRQPNAINVLNTGR